MNRSPRLAAASALAGLLCGGGAMWAFRAVPAPAGTAPAQTAPSATELAELETAAQRSEKISKPTLDALARPLPAFSFNGTLEHGLAKFADKTKLHLWIDWRAFTIDHDPSFLGENDSRIAHGLQIAVPRRTRPVRDCCESPGDIGGIDRLRRACFDA